MSTLINKISPLVVAGLMLISPAVIADQQIPDDLVVVGSLCVGLDCVNNESFGFDTLRLKENNLRIKFQDTSASSSFPTGDWQITVNDSLNGGANWIGIEDIDAGTTPFTILASAPNESLYVSASGNIGLGTTTPLVDLVIKGGNTPTLRLEQDGTAGFTSQVWDVGGNETNFFVRDVTNGSILPFRIAPNAPGGSIYVATDGDVGFETITPDGQFDIAHSANANNHAFLVSPVSWVGVNIDNGFLPRALFEIQDTGGQSRFAVKSSGEVGIGTFSPSGRFDVRDTGGTESYFNVHADGGVGIGTFAPVGRFEVKSTDGNSSYLDVDALGNVGVGTDTTHTYYGVKSSFEVLASFHPMIGVRSKTADQSASLGFSANAVDQWLISSRNGIVSDGGAGTTIERLAFYNKSFNELFTIHQSGSIFIGDSAGVNNNTTHQLEAASGAHLTTGGLWVGVSTRSAKDNIVDISIEEAKEALEVLNPVTFSYKKEPEETYAGFIAEDVPDLVATNDRKGLVAMDVVAVLTKVVQEQQKAILELTDRLEQLEEK